MILWINASLQNKEDLLLCVSSNNGKMPTDCNDSIDGSYAVKIDKLDSDPSGNEFKSKNRPSKTCMSM